MLHLSENLYNWGSGFDGSESEFISRSISGQGNSQAKEIAKHER